MAGDTIYEMGTDGKRYVIQRLELMACDTIYRFGNRWQEIRYTEIGADGRLFNIRDEINGRRYDIQRW